MKVKLRVLEGKNAGREISLAGPKFFIGRANDCQLRPRSEEVSRHHCVVLIEDDYAAIRDFGSKNGTFVNNERVKGEQELNAGDRLTVGTLRFEVLLSGDVVGTKQPEVEPVEETATHTAATGSDDSSADDGLDLDAWLGIGEKTPADADTRAVDLSELAAAQESAKPDPESSDNEGQDEDEPKVVGVSAKRAKSVSAGSSREAAEEALKKLLRGGR